MNHEWKVGELAMCIIPYDGYLVRDWIYPVSNVMDDTILLKDLSPEIPTSPQLLAYASSLKAILSDKD